MLKITLPALTTLFAGVEPCQRPVDFSWRLVRRKSHPFLLLPEGSDSVSDSFELYSAHRPLAKLWRLTVPLTLRTPMARLFDLVVVRADADGEFLQFLAVQSRLPVGQLQPPAIKFGGVVGKSLRMVLLLYDAGGHPVRVIKVGLDPQGRAATDREAELLSHLPKDVTGCTGITGRFVSDSLSAFATDYFSGASLDNDVGIEKLFHDWLNQAPPEPIGTLASWRELEDAAAGASPIQWAALRAALAGHTVRTTIYHGDFAPWNVRMTNLENIRAFDWERGQLKGIPAWDWFHYIVQTSILIERHSPERVAAELEQLFRSPRFQPYARDAGIGEILEPLLLAYLLNQKLVVQPREGAETTDRLFQLLWVQWQSKLNAGKLAPGEPADLRIPAREQIKIAWVRLSNLFWEPRLSPVSQPSFNSELRRHGLVLLAALVWIGGVAALHYFTDSHLHFTPFYLVPCVWLALTAGRRMALIAAYAGALAGPLSEYFREPGLISIGVAGWNSCMRLGVFWLIVVLMEGVRKQSLFRHPHPAPAGGSSLQGISGNWAVILIAIGYFAGVVVLDRLTNPHLMFMSLYLLPCVILTLAVDWRWGTCAAILAAVAAPWLQWHEDPGYQHWGVECWNSLMRFIIFQMVVLLVERIRRKNILFNAKT